MVGDALTLRTFLYVSNILVNSSLLFRRCQLLHKLTLRCQYHEGNTEDGIGTGGEDGERVLAPSLSRSLALSIYSELHLCTLRASNPVLLCLL